MRVYAAELICSTGVLDFHTFKLALCIHNKLCSHAEMLSWWAFDVTFPGSNPLRSNRSGLNVSNGGSWNPKLTLKVKSLWIKMKGQNFSSQVLSRHTFRILRKKGSDFFLSQGHFKFIELTIYQICLKIFSLVVDKRTKNNLYMHWVSGFYYYFINTQHNWRTFILNLFIRL